MVVSGGRAGNRRAKGEYRWQPSGDNGWTWDEALHSTVSDLAKDALPVTAGITDPTSVWTFHDAYAGIGGAASGLALAGGTCTAAFDQCNSARRTYAARMDITPDGAWGSFDYTKWPQAEVLFSAPPCEDYAGLVGHDDQRQMWKHLALVRHFKYQVVVIETLLHFKRMHNGMVFRSLVATLNSLGYDVKAKLLFAPDFGAVAARRRVYLVCNRRDGRVRADDLNFPIGDSTRHPVRSILEPEFFRRGVRLRRQDLVLFDTPNQRSANCLTQVGELRGTGPGRAVYSIHGLASTQLATGNGPGWTTGVYLINSTPSRLTVREAARTLQISDHLELDPSNAVAARHIGNTTAVGLARALGVSIERALVNATKDAGQPDMDSGSVNRRHWRLTPQGQPLSMALHAAKMIAWAAADAAKAVLDARWRYADTWWGAIDSVDWATAKHGIEVFHRRWWLILQKRRGLVEIENLRRLGADVDTIRRAHLNVRKALWLERMRAGAEESPIRLLWWNWGEPVNREILHGYKLPFRKKPLPIRPDNYDTANVQKVWDEFTRMLERGYMEGPFDGDGDEIYMTHPLAAVPKKHSEKLRIIVDCTASLLNECLVAQRFVLPQVQDAAAKCYKGCWMMTADLQDGFYGIEITGEDRKYVGLKHPLTGKYYRYTALAMGMACSPAAFSRLVAWAVKKAESFPEFRRHKVVVNDTDPNMPRVYAVNKAGRPVATSDWFVDDGLISAPTEQSCRAAYDRLVWVLESRLGWRICQRKSVGPTRKLEFCGLILDSIGGDVGGPCTRLSDERRKRCLDTVTAFLAKVRTSRRASRREMAQIVGELSFAANAIPPGRCFLVRLYDAIHEMRSECRGPSHDYDRFVSIDVGAFLDLRWWVSCLRESECIVLWRSRTFALHRCWSDASNYGFAESVAVNETDDYPQMAFTHGVWPEAVAGFSSNWHEMATITHSIVSRGAELQNSQVHYMTDNSTSVSCVNTGTVRSPQLMQLSRELKLAQAKHNIGIEAIHLSGELMQVQGTDGASRAMPYLGMYSGMAGSHDLFDPMEWPIFELTGELKTLAEAAENAADQNLSNPELWDADMVMSGRDSFLHLRPVHVAPAMELLMEAQLREGRTTSFTVIAPMVGLRKWRKYLKHFRSQQVHKVLVPGLGDVKHWLLRFEAGDALLPRASAVEDDMAPVGISGAASSDNDLSTQEPYGKVWDEGR